MHKSVGVCFDMVNRKLSIGGKSKHHNILPVCSAKNSNMVHTGAVLTIK